MQKPLLITLLAAAAFAAGCASTPAPAPAPQQSKAPEQAAPAAPVQTNTAAQAQEAIAAAEKSRDQAKAVGYEWRDTSEMIDDAKKAATAGEFDKAVKLAKAAAREGELAVKQQAIEAEKMAAKGK